MYRPFLITLAALLTTIPAQSLDRRLRIDSISGSATVSGSVKIIVDRDTVLRPAFIHTVLTVDGKPVATAGTLPWNTSWDSTSLPDGSHQITLRLVNSMNGTGTDVESLVVVTRNAPAPTAKPPVTPPLEITEKKQETSAQRGVNNAITPATKIPVTGVLPTSIAIAPVRKPVDNGRLPAGISGELSGNSAIAGQWSGVQGTLLGYEGVVAGPQGSSAIWWKNGNELIPVQAPEGTQWKSGGSIVVGSDGLYRMQAGQLFWLTLTESGPAMKQFPPLNGEGLLGQIRSPSSCAGHLWFAIKNVVFHATNSDGSMEAFLPWNEPRLRTEGVTVTDYGACVTTNLGERLIHVQQPTVDRGYDGYVRVRIGTTARERNADQNARIADAILDWQGTPYKYGGDSKSGIDCSGFVMRVFQAADIFLPHGSDELRELKRGEFPRDELRYGDVLVYPGHCAIYVGDGLTAETVQGHVGSRSIWMRDEVVVRRFLNVTDSYVPFASRGGRNNSTKARKP